MDASVGNARIVLIERTRDGFEIKTASSLAALVRNLVIETTRFAPGGLVCASSPEHREALIKLRDELTTMIDDTEYWASWYAVGTADPSEGE